MGKPPFLMRNGKGLARGSFQHVTELEPCSKVITKRIHDEKSGLADAPAGIQLADSLSF